MSKILCAFMHLQCFFRKNYEKMWQNSWRKRLTNDNFSILCPNCIGGLIYHRLGKPFLSPTINLWMNQRDFLKFILNLKSYLKLELYFINSKFDYPVATLGDITLHFNHYHNADEAASCWERRKKRIHYDNLFIIMYDKDGLSKEDIRSIENIKCRGRIVISNQEYPDLDYVKTIPVNMNDPKKRYRLDMNKWTGKRRFEQKIDIVRWLNEGSI